MDTHLSVTAVKKWMATVSGNRDTGHRILGKGNTILGRITPYILHIILLYLLYYIFVQFVNLIKIWVLVLITEAFKCNCPIVILSKRWEFWWHTDFTFLFVFNHLIKNIPLGWEQFWGSCYFYQCYQKEGETLQHKT